MASRHQGEPKICCADRIERSAGVVFPDGVGLEKCSAAEDITIRTFDADTLKQVVWEREQQRSTGIGEGLAIPHGKSDCSKNLVMAVGRPGRPIEFDAVDGQPVSLVVLLASPPDKTSEHIQALGKISRLMSNPSFRVSAYSAESAEEMYRLFEQHEG